MYHKKMKENSGLNEERQQSIGDRDSHEIGSIAAIAAATAANEEPNIDDAAIAPIEGLNTTNAVIVIDQRKIITVKKSNEFQYHRNNKIISKMQQLILIDKLYFLFKKIFGNSLHFYSEKT